MSRGYGRKSVGFKMVQQNSTVRDVGDEPLQYKLKHPQIPVSVAESRALGIPELLKNHPEINTIILDDGFQHLSVKPHLNILLTTYKDPYFKDFLLPSGRLREWSSAASRADAIIVTKCPPDMDASEIAQWEESLDLRPGQSLFFSTMTYGRPYSFFAPEVRVSLDTLDGVVLLSAIADSAYLEDYVTSFIDYSLVMSYTDHHNFDSTDISKVIENYNSMKMERKFVLTTEKDAMRLIKHRKVLYENKIPVFLLPLQVKFLFEDRYNFDDYIKEELLKVQV